jgi:hypothetical protein
VEFRGEFFNLFIGWRLWRHFLLARFLKFHYQTQNYSTIPSFPVRHSPSVTRQLRKESSPSL